MVETSYAWLSNFSNYMNENSDPRTKDWLFMESPLPLIILSICYLYFVCKVGPEYMKYRKPFNLKTAITVYNIFQILSCIYLIYSLMESGSFIPFSCETKDRLMDLKLQKTAKLIWWTTMLKLTEYIETVFFVLRKKQNQVSGLHLYHHVSTLSCAWVTSKFAPVAAAVTPIVINSFIHVLMYSYYLVALHGGKELQKKIVSWKRSLTILQMVQFTIIILHLLNGLRNNCSGPIFLAKLMLLNVFINYLMFFRFYKKTYNETKSK